jgi:hypothetical protein
MTPFLETLPLEELHRLARSRPRSGRGAAAKAAALRILERRARGRVDDPDLPEGVSLDDQVGIGIFWHPSPGSHWVELDVYDTGARRLRWRAALGREDEPLLRPDH